MVLNTILDPVFVPLLKATGYWGTIIILSIVITVITTLIYKYTTNQSLMKDLKEELKAFQKQIKELRNEPEKAMQVQKKMMETNSKYMMHSFKPMIFTFLPVILLFGWMTAHLEFYPLQPGEEFNVNVNFDEGATGNVTLLPVDGLEIINGATQQIQANKATFTLKGIEGEYLLLFNVPAGQVSNTVKISTQPGYAPAKTTVKKFGVTTIVTEMKPVLLLNLWFHHFGWLGTYIILSIIFSSLLRKWMKVY